MRTNSSGHTKPRGRIDRKTEPQLVRPAATNANAIPLSFYFRNRRYLSDN
jgi:hypothetical protein